MNKISYLSTLLSLLIVSSLSGCGNVSMNQALQMGLDASTALTQHSSSSYGEAIKQTLELSSTRASGQLAQPGGYSQNDNYKIFMPESLSKITGTLKQLGLGQPINDIEALMNSGAEQAAVEAKGIFVQAVKEMTITNAISIIQGSDTAATEYFKEKTEVRLREVYQPIIEKNLSNVGFYTQYKSFLQVYNSLPISKPSLDLEQHALDQSLKALFSQVAIEEAMIRKDPVGKGSELINAVFNP